MAIKHYASVFLATVGAAAAPLIPSESTSAGSSDFTSKNDGSDGTIEALTAVGLLIVACCSCYVFCRATEMPTSSTNASVRTASSNVNTAANDQTALLGNTGRRPSTAV